MHLSTNAVLLKILHRRNTMQPNRLALRRIVLCLLFVCSIVAISFMAAANAEEVKADTSDASVQAPSESLELEVQRDADEAEAREGKIALFVNFVQITGVTTELEGEEVYVPVRFFAEAMLDCKVIYSSGAGKLTIKADGLDFEAVCGLEYIVANERYLFVEGGVELREDGQIWLPLSMLSKIFGCEYTLDRESKAAYLTTTGEFIEHGDDYYNSKDLYWLSRIINAESRGECLLGQVAVGTVVLNRTEHPKYPNTIYGVIFDVGQFSPAVSGSIYKSPLPKCVIAAKIVLEGYRVSDTIIYFHSINASKYEGFVNTETEMVIGNQISYTHYGR